MARRRKKRREDAEVSYWLSYSDMMAGLLLMFVVVISFTMMQAKSQYEEDARQLLSQQQTLEEQETTLLSQQQTLAEQEATLQSQQEELKEKEITLQKQTKELETAQTTLKSQTKELEAQQAAAALQQKELEEKQTTVDTQSQQLEAQQALLDQQTTTLSSQQQQLEEQQAALTAQAEQLQTQTEQLQTQTEQMEAQKEQLQIQTDQLRDQTLQLQAQQNKIESQQLQMQQLIGIRTELVEALREAFSGTARVSVDSKTGAIMFDSNVLFDYNAAELRPEGESFLEDFLPQYFNVLLGDDFRDYVSEIIIEGHTDTDGDYMTNLELSQQRALAVARYCLEDESGIIDEDVVEKLRDIVTANGRSYSNPIYNEDGTIDMDASRRVEIKFRLREEEMVDQMMEILSES